MNNVVIIGNSASGFRCAEALAKLSPFLKVTLVSKGGTPAFRRDMLLEYLAGARKEKELYLCNEGYYASSGIDLQQEKEVSRLDTKRQKVVLKDNTRIAYDWLVIASGVKPAPVQIPGVHKEGVFFPYGIREYQAIKKRLDIVHTACVVGAPASCSAFAQVLAAAGKEVKIISDAPFEGWAPDERIEWISENPAVEIIGEGMELKALKLRSGKVIGTSLVVFTGNWVPATDFVKESGLEVIHGALVVDENLRSSIDTIFACGAARHIHESTNKEWSWQDAQDEGLRLAGIIIQAYEGRKAVCQQTS